MNSRPVVRAWASLGRILWAVLVLALVVYAATCWYLSIHQRDLIFMPSRDIARTPADVHLQYKEVFVPIGATSLHGWWLPAEDETAPAILYLHGNDLNIGADLDHFARIRRLGFSVLAVDYRGYGKSGGEFPSEA